MHPLLPLGRGGGHKTRSKPHPPPEFHPNQELKSLDESATLMDVKQTLGDTDCCPGDYHYQVEHLSQDKASQVAPISGQPETKAGGNPTAASSASIDLDMEEQVRMRVEH